MLPAILIAQMRDKIEGEIEVELMEEIIKTLPKLTAMYSESHSILIHGMGGQTRNFYNDIRQNNNIELLWTGWSSNKWWTYLLNFIHGQAGLVKVLDRSQLDNLYTNIGRLSMCGLYYISKDKVDNILEAVKKDRGKNIEVILDKVENYFLLTVDFDYNGGDRDGEILYREFILGANLDTEIKWTLTG